MIFSLNYFLIIVGALLGNYAICIEYVDQDDETIEFVDEDYERIEIVDVYDEVDLKADSIMYNGCEFQPLKVRPGYFYICGNSTEYSRGKVIFINNGTDQEEIIYEGFCEFQFIPDATTTGYCRYHYTADKYTFNIQEPSVSILQNDPGDVILTSGGFSKCVLSCVGK